MQVENNQKSTKIRESKEKESREKEIRKFLIFNYL